MTKIQHRPTSISSPTRATIAPLLDRLHAATAAIGKHIALMEVCGTHTMAAFRSGLHSLLPSNLTLLSGPGCPVCVTSQGDIDLMIELARLPGTTLCTYGDMLRVPGLGGSLEIARAQGADIRIIYSTLDAVDCARTTPDRQVILGAVGFETTAPATAAAVLAAEDLDLHNFSVFASHKRVLPAMLALLQSGDVSVDGFLCPGHVSAIIGADVYQPICDSYHLPCVISGFEDQHMLVAITRLVELIRDGRAELVNEYPEAVSHDGNRNALDLLDRVFEPATVPWCALGSIPDSGLSLRSEFSSFDARKRFHLGAPVDREIPGCMCGKVITGSVTPHQCKLFARLCTPINPIGPCMVSSEGTCQAYFKYARIPERFSDSFSGAPGTGGIGMIQIPQIKNVLPASTVDRTSRIVLAHGGGGQLTDDLIHQHLLPRFGNDILNELLDAAIVKQTPGRLAMTIDSFVVQPLRFPGGDIGRLAVSGTINDLAVSGAKPLGLALAMILAEGFPMSDLESILDSIATTAKEAGVRIITGDTKVVGRGQADGVYLITAGIGRIPTRRQIGPAHVKPGQLLIINGPIGDHGLAVMIARELPEMQSTIQSDVAPLNGLIDAAFATGERNISFMRDPTRGGLAGLCADLAHQCGHRIVLHESEIAVRPEARHAADMLGLDPLDIANEGKVVFAVAPRAAQRVLAALKSHPLGRDAAIIGEVASTPDGLCELRTTIGGRRIVQKPYGEQLPRIC